MHHFLLAVFEQSLDLRQRAAIIIELAPIRLMDHRRRLAILEQSAKASADMAALLFESGALLLDLLPRRAQVVAKRFGAADQVRFTSRQFLFAMLFLQLELLDAIDALLNLANQIKHLGGTEVIGDVDAVGGVVHGSGGYIGQTMVVNQRHRGIMGKFCRL
jgi:hypothetical protein